VDDVGVIEGGGDLRLAEKQIAELGRAVYSGSSCLSTTSFSNPLGPSFLPT